MNNLHFLFFVVCLIQTIATYDRFYIRTTFGSLIYPANILFFEKYLIKKKSILLRLYLFDKKCNHNHPKLYPYTLFMIYNMFLNLSSFVLMIIIILKTDDSLLSNQSWQVAYTLLFIIDSVVLLSFIIYMSISIRKIEQKAETVSKYRIKQIKANIDKEWPNFWD